MTYTVNKDNTFDMLQPTGGKRVGRSFSQIECIWAQDGEKHYVREDYYYSPNEPPRSSVKVFEPERTIEGELPDLNKGYVRPRYNHDLHLIAAAMLGWRPFVEDYTLSEVLIPDCASVHEELDAIEGREAYVVDARGPSGNTPFARIWIDKQRGVPLQVWHFDKHPNWSDARVFVKIGSIRHHRLPNGGWVPIQGARSICFSGDVSSRTHIEVDIDSIKTKREDIPDSMFQVEFPDGAHIHNAFTRLTSVKGKPLKTYQEVVNAAGSYIAGEVVDEEGLPVSGVVVSPFCIKTEQENGRFGLRSIQLHERTCAVTDPQGRFAVELEEEGLYELWFCPKEHVDVRKPDVPLGEHDLKITLHKGGTVTGRVVRIIEGKKVPVANAEVTAKETERVHFTTLRSSRVRAKTDARGRFQIRFLETRTLKRGTNASEPQQYVPLTWQLTCRSATKTVVFDNDQSTQDVELVLEPDLRQAIPLVGRTLPDFAGIETDLPPNRIKDKMVLVCFFDMNQRPSRNCLTQLAKQVQALGQQGVTLVAVQATKVDESTLGEWTQKNKISFPIGMTQDYEKHIRFEWAVCSLPWLILTDKDHTVTAEGFGLNDLDDIIRKAKETK
jgi:hypothetical protein